MLLGGGMGSSLMLYYIIKAPLTKNLYFESAKSALLALTTGLVYYRIQNYYFNENIHPLYLVTLERTRGLKNF